MKKFFLLFAVAFFATNMMAQSGLSCEDPIPVDSNYVGEVDGPCTVWYTASTYDLPLNVHFIPEADDSDWWPEVMIDLTCVPGVYDDSKIDSIIKMAEGFDITFPVELTCDRVVNNGKVEWDLFVDAMYREQLAEFGVTYDVPAFVQVTFYEAGKITLNPDTTFSSCMENAEHVVLDDSITIQTNDSNRVFMMPYTDWQEDSIQFVWTGDQPAYVYMASNECNFMPSTASGYVWACYTVTKDEPFKVSNKHIKDAITAYDGGGLFYSKILSASEGKMVVEKIPMRQAQGGAIVMEYGVPIELQANDTTLYCFPNTWSATEFVSTASVTAKVYMSNTSNFLPVDADENVIDTYPFTMLSNGSNLTLSSREMDILLNSSTDDYIYVRFQCASSTTITAYPWDASDCADKSRTINSGKRFNVAAKSSSNILRLRYDDWKGGDMVINWEGQVRIPTYIADTCSFTLSSSNKRVLKYTSIKAKTIETYDAATVDSWESRVDADGFLYVRMNPNSAGYITFTSIKPEPVLPDTIFTTITETLCYGESYEWNGQVYATTGEYTQNFTAANGADSIVTLKLTILPEVAPTTEEATIEAGETYTWNGKEYSEAGEYTITLQDKNGCDYQATLVLTVNEPLSPCLQSSIKLNVGDEVVINLDSAFTVYAIDYAAWMAQPVTLVWTGAEALHTFVAETCVFALAPYNRYVHAYVPVPAQGDSALDMEALAPYVDADGYLYVRFLTEFEGTLKVGR